MSKWEKFLRVAKVIELTAVVLGMGAIIVIPLQIRNFKNNEGKNAYDLLIKYEEQLGSQTNEKIFNTIENDKSILDYNGGKFNEDQVINFLDIYESIASTYKHNLADLDLVCDWFGDSLATVMQNKEIENYINETRKDNTQYYIDLVKLSTDLKRINCFQ